MSYYNYYQNKEKRKAEALEHFRKMEILMKDEIGQSVKETKAYGGNGFPIPHTGKKRSDSVIPNITVEPLDTVSAVFLHQQGKTAVLNFACVYVVQCSHTSSGILHLEQQTQKQLPVHRPGALQ